MALAPHRPYLLILTGVLLAGAFYMAYRRPSRACGRGESCAMPQASRAGRIMLWIATVVVLLTATFPYYSAFLF